MGTPADYEAWYHTPRGAWIARREFDLMWSFMGADATPAASLLDVGAGTGHFSRRFAAAGLRVTGIEPDPQMLAFARAQSTDIPYIEGRAETLPLADASFDYVAAVTSLCFVAEPQRALCEMWRVARRGVILGLLHRHSLLHHSRAGRGGYSGRVGTLSKKYGAGRNACVPCRSVWRAPQQCCSRVEAPWHVG